MQGDDGDLWRATFRIEFTHNSPHLGVVAAGGFAARTSVHRLAVEAGGVPGMARFLFPADAVAQAVVNGVESTIVPPLIEIAPNGAFGREVFGEVAPLATGAYQVQNGIEDIAHRVLRGRPPGYTGISGSTSAHWSSAKSLGYRCVLILHFTQLDTPYWTDTYKFTAIPPLHIAWNCWRRYATSERFRRRRCRSNQRACEVAHAPSPSSFGDTRMRRTYPLFAVLLVVLLLGSDSLNEYDDKTTEDPLEGRWRLTGREQYGVQTKLDVQDQVFITFHSGTFTVNTDTCYYQGKYRIAPIHKPPQLDGELFTHLLHDHMGKCIYQIDGDRLKIAALAERQRPKGFDDKNIWSITCERVK